MLVTIFLAAAAWSRSNERFCEPSGSEVPDRSFGHVRTATEGPHAACPRGALIATRTRGPSRGRHRVACPRGAMLRFRARPSDHHPTGINPAVMKSASLTLAGCDCRPTGTSPVETCGGIRRNKQEKQGRRNKDRHCVSTGCEMLSLHGRSMRGQFGQPYQCPVLRPVHDSLC